MNKNFWMSEFSVGVAWISAIHIEGMLKLITMAIGLVSAAFFCVKMYYDMRSSANDFRANKIK